MRTRHHINVPTFRESRKRGFLNRWQHIAVALLTIFTVQPGNAWSVVDDSSVTSSLAGSQKRHAQASVGVLIMKAREKGTVRLIVTLDSASELKRGFAGVQALEAQKAATARAQSEVLDWLAVQNVQNVKRFQYSPGMALEVDAAALEVLQTNPHVVSIYEDIPVPPALADSIPSINANDVWADGIEGSGQTVAILDSGVDSTHEFLNGKVVSEACYSSTVPSNGASSLCPNGTTTQIGTGAGANCTFRLFGNCWHGTHVAGIAAGRDSGRGFDGVARGANIMAIQVFSRFDDDPSRGIVNCANNNTASPCVLSYRSDQILGLERVYALRNTYNIAAVNMSLGGGKFTAPCDTDTAKPIIDNLLAAGIPTVIASGNDGYSNAVSSPGCISSAITVGATGKSDDVADVLVYFSNSASMVDLLAPGFDIRSSVPPGVAFGLTYSNKSGTSMAAPHVAGAFALLKSANSGATVSDLLAALKNTGVSVTDTRVTNGVTKPRINLKAAYDAVNPPPILSPKPGIRLFNKSVTFTGGHVSGDLQHWLYVGTTKGGAQIRNQNMGTTHSLTVSGLPIQGKIWVRYWTKLGSTWKFSDQFYEMDVQVLGTLTPKITSPIPGSTLTSTTVTFKGGQAIGELQHYLFVGTTGVGSRNITYQNMGTTRSLKVSGLPWSGKIYVRYWTRFASGWKYQDHTYTMRVGVLRR